MSVDTMPERRKLRNIGDIHVFALALHAVFLARDALELGTVGVQLLYLGIVDGRRVLVGLDLGAR